jgi:hypothetical protein
MEDKDILVTSVIQSTYIGRGLESITSVLYIYIYIYINPLTTNELIMASRGESFKN